MKGYTFPGGSIQIISRKLTNFPQKADTLHLMTSLRKKITAAFIATALIVPTTAGVASAQSSFVSGSSSSSDGPAANPGSNVRQIEKTIEQAVIDNGQMISPVAEAKADQLLKRALNYELPFVDDLYETLEESPLSYGAVNRIPVDEIDEFLSNIGSEENLTGISIPLGIAVGKDTNYYYLAIIMLLN